ncbi:MarR family winged helix-turn-helix transcriptional regulator [Haloferula sp. BvORR071]|uniref:MarR family winged helix-turn-helix transcriptional regulator n=1 Tax=Haloferula sp. BvORR071 TaxID=1396141 RepID=UPI00054EF3FB|nr:MarR family winged helix-turn-helix transcriptional regulator [Haloferula sp. BvORR071]
MKRNGTPAAGDEVITEFASTCLLMRTRLTSRVLTGVYDDELRQFGLNAPQFAMLVVIYRIGPASRAEIGRYHHQDRSTLTRNLKVLISEGWIEEIATSAGGRARPMVLTAAGLSLLHKVRPAWEKAQEKAKSMLGDNNVAAIEDMAKRLMKSKPG